MFSNKKIIFMLFFLVCIIIIPNSFASDGLSDNITDDVLGADELNSTLAVDSGDVLTASNDYYFDASCDDDSGNGSINSPYKYLTADRIKNNANIYLADGEYDLDTYKNIEQVNIFGSDASKTIIKYDGIAFTVSRFLTLANVTLMDLSITNNGDVNVTNSIFTGGNGSKPDMYGNNYGGAIYTSGTKSHVNIVNSTFIDNYAVYGGAVYMGAGYLSIVGCEFIDNVAFNYGGAIACEKAANVVISKSKFYRNIALNDAGGAIYIKMSDGFDADSIDVINSTATFGGAITTLETPVSLNNLNISNNVATWDGGAIYHMYGTFALTHGNFFNNSARNGGALFIDNSTSLYIRGNKFTNNTASMYAGAVYSLLNKLNSSTSIDVLNTFNNNSAQFFNNVYQTDSINLTIGNGNYTLYRFNDTIISILPAYYSLVEEGYLTPVKDQQSSGNCWAFTAIAVLESCIKKITGVEFDLSEENMKNVIARFSDYGWKIETNDGGYDDMPWAYLASWLGPVLEVDDSFDDKSVLSPILDSISHIQNIVFFKRDNLTDNDGIKKAILKYGAVGTNMYFNNSYINSGFNYYCWNGYTSNHAVTIVGWDDNYSRDNFKFGSYAEGDGAWIVRNSWGPDWGNDGYFYVSYYDKTLAKTTLDVCAYTFMLNDTIRFDRNYQYDIGGRTDYFISGLSNMWYKNRFTADENEILFGVSTYFIKPTNWTVYIYVNGDLKGVKNGTSNLGYYTFNLDEGINLTIGDTFEVVFNTATDDLSWIPISEYLRFNKLTYSENISFISADGVHWYDLFNYIASYSTHVYSSQVACIKAFTIFNDFNTTLSLDISSTHNPVTITATVKDQYGHLVKTGVVTFRLPNENVTVNVVDGKASVTRNFDEGTYDVYAVFSGKSYISSSNATSFEVTKENVTLSVGVSKYQNNVTLAITTSKEINGKIIIAVNGNESSIKISKGKVYHRLTDLSNGQYNISVSLYGDDYNSNVVNLSVNVNVKHTSLLASDFTTGDYSGELYTVLLVDEDGTPIANKKIIFILNNEKINAFTNDSGRASIPLNLDVGNYTVTYTFNDEDDYYGSFNSSSIQVKNNVTIVLKDLAYQNNILINISLSKPISTTLALSVNNKNQSVNIQNGKGSVYLTGLDNDDYYITSYLGDDFIFVSNDLNITVDVKNTQIIAPMIITSDENTSYMVTLLDEDANPISGKSIEFRFGNGVYSNLTGDDGVAMVCLNLVKGTNPIDVAFAGDNNLFDSANSSQIIFKPLLTAEIEAVNIASSKWIEVSFSKPINGSAVISINGEEFPRNVVNGGASLEMSALENKFYLVSVELLGDEYNFTETSINFTISLKNTTLLAGDFITWDFSQQNYMVMLIDEIGSPISNQSVRFAIGDEITYATTNEYGQASICIDRDYGNYSVEVTYTPVYDALDIYSGCVNSSNIIVKINMYLVTSLSKILRDATIELSFSKPVNDTISVIVNDENNPVKITNGCGVLDLHNLENGNYTVKIRLDENKYLVSSYDFDFDMDVKSSKIIANAFETFYQSGEYYTIQLLDEDGLPIKQAQITVTIAGVGSYDYLTSDEGIISMPVKLNNGNYNVLIKYGGDNNHFSSQLNTNMVVNPGISFTNNHYTLNSDYVVLLKGNVNGNLVNIRIDNVLYAIAAADGRASFKVNLNVGSHTVQVTNPVTGEVQSQNIQVSPRLTDNGNVIMYYGANKVYGVKVHGDNGNTVGAGEIVVFTIGGKKYGARTDGDGVASVKLNGLKAKTYTITSEYKGYKVSNKIKIKPTLITKNKSVKKGNVVKFTAKLLNSKGKALKGKKIIFKIKNKKYKAKTNKKGIATIKIKKLKAGKYKITSKYGKITNVNTIKVRR